MSLFSASEDFTLRTLKHVHGAIHRLFYLTTLRDRDGNYHHWGMARSFGDDASQRAAQDAHKAALNEVLRTPLHELWGEVAERGSCDGRSTGDVLQLMSTGSWVLPPGCSPAAEAHFNSVLLALREIAMVAKETSTRPAA